MFVVCRNKLNRNNRMISIHSVTQKYAYKTRKSQLQCNCITQFACLFCRNGSLEHSASRKKMKMNRANKRHGAYISIVFVNFFLFRPDFDFLVKRVCRPS